jgi:hypothetical protein
LQLVIEPIHLLLAVEAEQREREARAARHVDNDERATEAPASTQDALPRAAGGSSEAA